MPPECLDGRKGGVDGTADIDGKGPPHICLGFAAGGYAGIGEDYVDRRDGVASKDALAHCRLVGDVDGSSLDERCARFECAAFHLFQTGRVAPDEKQRARAFLRRLDGERRTYAA